MQHSTKRHAIGAVVFGLALVGTSTAGLSQEPPAELVEAAKAAREQ